MTCDRYLELLALRPDGTLTQEEERELEEHLTRCPGCRAAGAQLAALQAGFDALEDIEAPENFAQGVMERIQTKPSGKKVIPLFKRPQFRALAGLAACAALVIGLYGAARPQKDAEEFHGIVQNFSGEADYFVLQGRAAASGDDAPTAAAYSGMDESIEGMTDGLPFDMQKAVPDGAPIRNTALNESDCCTFENDQYLRVTYDHTPESGAQIIGSTQSLEDFLSQFPVDDLSAVQTWYDGTYFASGRLLAVVAEEPSGSIRHQISELLRDQVIIRQTSPYCTEDLAAWLILAEVDGVFSDGDELTVTIIPWKDNSDS